MKLGMHMEYTLVLLHNVCRLKVSRSNLSAAELRPKLLVVCRRSSHLEICKISTFVS